MKSISGQRGGTPKIHLRPAEPKTDVKAPSTPPPSPGDAYQRQPAGAGAPDIAPAPGRFYGQGSNEVAVLNRITGSMDLSRAFQAEVFSQFSIAETWPPQYAPRFPESVERLNSVITQLADGNPGSALASMLKGQFGRSPAPESLWQSLGALVQQHGSAMAKQAWAEAGGA